MNVRVLPLSSASPCPLMAIMVPYSASLQLLSLSLSVLVLLQPGLLANNAWAEGTANRKHMSSIVPPSCHPTHTHRHHSHPGTCACAPLPCGEVTWWHCLPSAFAASTGTLRQLHFVDALAAHVRPLGWAFSLCPHVVSQCTHVVSQCTHAPAKTPDPHAGMPSAPSAPAAPLPGLPIGWPNLRGHSV